MKAQLSRGDELGWLVDLAQEHPPGGACPKALARAKTRLFELRAELKQLRRLRAAVTERTGNHRHDGTRTGCVKCYIVRTVLKPS